jgi:phage protein D/phage baseplate assembly protein gpV
MTAADFYAPRFDVRISGLTMAADVASQVVSLMVDTNLDLAGSFALTLRNPDNLLLDSALFDLGKTVEVHLGYGDTLQPAFLGEITAVEPMFPRDGAPVVRVSGYDKSYRMRHSQPEPTEYKFANDAIIAARIAIENGLIPLVDPTPGIELSLPRAGSDMAFLKSRAKKYFFDVYVEWDRLHFQFPRPQTAAYTLEWGRNLSSFSPRISATGLAGIEVIRDYNQELAQTIFGIAVSADFDLDDLEERLGSAAVELLASLIRKGIRTGAPMKNPVDAMTLAKALLAELLEGMYEGRGECVGIPDLKAGSYIAIRGVGKRFSGTYRLRKVTHTIDGNGYRTEFDITQRAHSSLAGLLRKRLLHQPDPDEAQRMEGVVVAEVIDNYEISGAQVPLGRVRVRYPGLSGDLVSSWAPCARPMAGSGSGFYSLPQPGDQVLVAFERGNLESPYVVGALWNLQSQPPVTNLDGTNSVSMIKSRSGHTVTFDDTIGLGKLTIESSSGHTISCEDTPAVGKVMIKTAAGHSITCDDTTGASELVIQAATGPSITMKPDGSMEISAPTNLTLSATDTLTLSGTTVKIDATAKVEATANQDIGLSVGGTSLKVTNDHVDVN